MGVKTIMVQKCKGRTWQHPGNSGSNGSDSIGLLSSALFLSLVSLLALPLLWLPIPLCALSPPFPVSYCFLGFPVLCAFSCTGLSVPLSAVFTSPGTSVAPGVLSPLGSLGSFSPLRASPLSRCPPSAGFGSQCHSLHMSQVWGPSLPDPILPTFSPPRTLLTSVWTR